MPRSMWESYRQLEIRFYIVAALLVVSILAWVLLAYLYGGSLAASSGQLYNYSQLFSKLNSTQSQLSVLTAKYAIVDHNLTTPYTKVLFNDYTVNIPKKVVSAATTSTNSSGSIQTTNMTNVVTYYSYNFSFNASYPGYLLVNASSTGVNSAFNTTWQFVVSNHNIMPNSTSKYYFFQYGGYFQNPYTPTVTNRGAYKVNFDQNSPRTVYAPMPTQGEQTVMIPVAPGIVHVWITNFNNQSITVTFSAKYVGFYTR